MHFRSTSLLRFLSAAIPSLSATIKQPNLKLDIQISTAEDNISIEDESHPTGSQEPYTASGGDINTIDDPFTLQLAGNPVGSSDQDTIHANYYPFSMLTPEKAIVQPYFTLVNGTLRQGKNVIARYYRLRSIAALRRRSAVPQHAGAHRRQRAADFGARQYGR